MKPHSRVPEQDDLLRLRLVDMIDARHDLVKLAALIDWNFFEREWATFFPSHQSRPATSPRLIAGLIYLQHACRLSDEAVTGKTHVATALGIQAIEHHRRKVRFFSTIEMVNTLEQEKARGRTGQLAETLMRLDLVILDEDTCRSAPQAAPCSSTC